MIHLPQALHCPVSSLTGGLGELDPINCPIIYCPPTEDGRGNYAAAVCVKYTNYPGIHFLYRKQCFIDVCNRSCEALQSEEVIEVVSAEQGSFSFMTDKYNVTISVGCRDGNFSSIDNQTIVLPNSTVKDFTKELELSRPRSSSSSNQLQMNLFMPLLILFVLLLTSNKFTQRLSL